MLSAAPDSVVTTAATPVTINVLANDTGTGLVVTSFSNPANGSLVFNGDKSFTYTPAAGFLGEDTFSYTVRDASGTLATAEVTISVIANDGATVATDDFVEVVAGGGVIVPVLANDLAAGGGALQVIAVSVPGHGVVNVLANQSIRYVPQTGFIGLDSFTYTVIDEQGTTASATVTVKVVAENSAPIASNDAFSVVADTTTVLAVLANDSDPDGGPLQVVGFTMPSHGSLVFDVANKTFSYTPEAGYEGLDQFTYTIRDARGASASAAVVLTVARIVESPVAVDDQVTTEAGVPVIIDVLANDTLPAGQQVGIIAVTLPFKGRLDFNADKTITYTPNLGFVGTDDFTYTIGNGKGGTAKATVMIEVTGAMSSEWQPTPSPELTATIDALEAAAGGYIFVPQVGGMRTINASRDAVGNGDPVGFWPDVLSSQTGLTADGDGRPTWDDGEGAIRFVQPAATRGRALFFPQDVTATKWHFVFCMKSTDDSKFFSQSVVQFPAMRVITNWQGIYNLQAQIVQGAAEFFPIKSGSISNYTLVEIRRDGNVLQTRTNGQEWREHVVANWATYPAAEGDPSTSMFGRSNYSDNDYPDFVSWSGLINGAVVALDHWLDGAGAEAARAVVVAGQAVADLNPESDSPPQPAPVLPDSNAGTTIYPAATRVVNVSNASQLSSALANRQAGDHIVLANGTYSGNFSIDGNGTESAPIVIRAANLIQARIVGNSTLTVRGNHVWTWGLQFDGKRNGGGCIDITGLRHKIIGCRFFDIGSDTAFTRNNFIAGEAGRSDFLEIGYCDFDTPRRFRSWISSDGQWPQWRFGMRFHRFADRAPYDLWVHHCHFRNFPVKPDTNYRSAQSDAIEIAAVGSNFDTRNRISHCLFENIPDDSGSIIDIKAGGAGIAEYLTTINCAGRIDIRDADNWIVRHIWMENTQGIGVMGKNHEVSDVRMFGGARRIMAHIANLPYTDAPGGDQRRQVSDLIIQCCPEADIRVGLDWSTSPTYLPRNVQIRGATASVSIASGSSNITQNPGFACSPSKAVKLSAANVGPVALPA